MPRFWKKNPDPSTLVLIVFSDKAPDDSFLGHSEENEINEWIKEQKDAGWTSVYPKPEPQEDSVEIKLDSLKERILAMEQKLQT